MEKFTRREFVKRYIQTLTKEPITTALGYATGGMIMYDSTKQKPQISYAESAIAGAALGALRDPLRYMLINPETPISRRKFVRSMSIDAIAGAAIGISTKTTMEVAKAYD
jgi:hypothetical protein